MIRFCVGVGVLLFIVLGWGPSEAQAQNRSYNFVASKIYELQAGQFSYLFVKETDVTSVSAQIKGGCRDRTDKTLYAFRIPHSTIFSAALAALLNKKGFSAVIQFSSICSITYFAIK